MLINLRNALMTKQLPYDAEVEFLECAGTSSVFPYIDTGIVGSMDVTVSARIWRSTRSTNECAMGSWDGGNTRCWPLYFNGNKYYLGMGPLASALTEVTSEAWHDIALTKSGNTFIYTADGTVVGQASSTSTFASMRTLYIGAMNNTGNPNFFFRGRFAFVKIYVAGILVRDFIPVRKGTVGYLYDRVSGQLFGNAGTGDFVLGPDVVPVEYLQSSGTQWIDTGVVPAANDTFTVETRKNNASQDNASFGLAGCVYCFSNGFAGKGYGTFWGHPAVGLGGMAEVNPLGDTNWHTIMASPTSVSVDGVALGNRTGDAQSPLSTVKLFARGNNSASGGVAKQYNGMISHALINRGGSDLRKFYAVRVGTEGAMMDVLTRRIYRNAGTGAFAYGNDLKYPIPAA